MGSICHVCGGRVLNTTLIQRAWTSHFDQYRQLARLRKWMWLVVLTMCWMPLTLCAADAPDAAGFDLRALVGAGSGTSAKFRFTPAQWTVENTLSNGAVIECSIL